MQALRELFIEQQAAVTLARGLLDAAVGIAQQIAQHGCERQRRQARYGQPCQRRIGEQAIDRAGAEADWFELVQLLRGRTHHARPCGTHHHLELAADLDAAAGHVDADLANAIAVEGAEREGQRGFCTIGQFDLAFALRDRQRLGRAHLDRKFVLAAGEILQIEREAGLVAGSQHARRGDFGDQRCADDGFGVAAAVLVFAERQRGDAHGAVEIGHLQRDLGFTFGIERDGTGEQVDGEHLGGRATRLRQWAQRHVAAVAEFGGGAVEAFDDAAVQVIGIDAERALGKEPGVGIGACEARDVEDADIDCRYRHVGLLAGQCRHLHRHRQVGFRLHLLRCLEGDVDLAVTAIHLHPSFADGAGRGDLVGGRTAAEHQRGDIDVVALPVLGHRDFERCTGLGVDVARVQQMIRLHQQHAGAGLRRRHRDL